MSPLFVCGAGFDTTLSGMELGALVEQVVQGLGYELVDLDLSPRGRLLRVFIDQPAEAGKPITVEDCTSVSNQLQRVFEVENIDYDRLEVSSPGLDRVLKKRADFTRFAGSQIQLRIRLPIENQRNFIGVLKGLREDAVVIETAKGELAIAFEDVEKARLVPKF